MRSPAVLLLLLSACGGSSTGAPDAAASPDAAIGGPLVTWFDLPRVLDTQSLSAAYFDADSATLYTIQDFQPSLVALQPSANYQTWSVGATIDLVGRPGSGWDGEGLTRGADGTFYAVTIETQPLLERFSSTGSYLGAIATPPRFAMQPPGNMGIESLSLSPSGKYLFFANEGALTTDGSIATKTSGTRLRILRRDLATGTDEEHAYLTEPCGDGSGGTLGVSDVTAFSDTEVLVLERGYQAGYGNTVRIFRADLGSSADVSGATSLDAATPTLTKTLVLDLAMLSSDGVPVGETQPNPILDNYEGLALGPTLPDGRRVVFVVSDDNRRDTQVARVLTLALSL